jgi:hypothetical protein
MRVLTTMATIVVLLTNASSAEEGEFIHAL